MEIDATVHQHDRSSQKDAISAHGSSRPNSYSRVMSTKSGKKPLPTHQARCDLSLRFQLVCRFNEVEGTRLYELKNILPSKTKKPSRNDDKENSKSSDYVIPKRQKSSIAEPISKLDNPKNNQSGRLQDRSILPESKPKLRSKVEPETPNPEPGASETSNKSKAIAEESENTTQVEPKTISQAQSVNPEVFHTNTAETLEQQQPRQSQQAPQEGLFRDPPAVPQNTRRPSPSREASDAHTADEAAGHKAFDFTGVTIDLTLDDEPTAVSATCAAHLEREAHGQQQTHVGQGAAVLKGAADPNPSVRDTGNETATSRPVVSEVEPAAAVCRLGGPSPKAESCVRKSSERRLGADGLLRKRDFDHGESLCEGSRVLIPDPRPFATTYKRFLSSLDKGIEAVVHLLSRQVETLIESLINSSKISFLTRQSLKKVSQQVQNFCEGKTVANQPRVGERRELMSSKISSIGKNIRVLSRIVENLPGELGIRTRGRIVEIGLELEEVLKEHKRAFSNRASVKTPDITTSRIRTSRENGWSSRRNTYEFGLSERTTKSRLGYSSKNALFRIQPTPQTEESFVRAGWIKEREFYQRKMTVTSEPTPLLLSSPQTALEAKLGVLATSIGKELASSFDSPQSSAFQGDFLGFWDSSQSISVAEPEPTTITSEVDLLVLAREHNRMEKAVSRISRWWRKLSIARGFTSCGHYSFELELPPLKFPERSTFTASGIFTHEEESENSAEDIKIGSNKSIASQSKGNPGSQSTQDGSSAVRSQISSQDSETSFLTRISSTKINKSFDLRLPLEYLPFFFNRLKGMELKHALAFWMLHGCLPSSPRDSLKAPEKIEPLRKIDLQTARVEILAQPYVCTRRRPIKKEGVASGSFEAWEEHLRRKIMVDRRKIGSKPPGANAERVLPTSIISSRANMIQVVPAATNHPFLLTLRAYFSMPYSEYTDYMKTLPSLLSHACFQANMPCPVLPVMFENKLPLSVFKSFEEGNKHLQQVQGVLRVFGNQLPVHSTEPLRTGLDDARLIDKNITSGNPIKGAGLRVKGGMLRVDSDKVELRLDFKFPVAPFSDFEDIKQTVRLSIGGTDLL